MRHSTGLGSTAFAECVRVREPLVNLFQDCFGGAFERKIQLRGDRSRFEVDFDRSRAGWTREDVPIARKTSHVTATKDRSRISGSIASPNHTTPGLRMPPQ